MTIRASNLKSVARWPLAHRRKLWPVVWAFFCILLLIGLRMSWPSAVILSTVPASAYVILAFTLPWKFKRTRSNGSRRWYQFSLKQLCLWVAVGSPILAVVLRFPYWWVDLQRQHLNWHGDVGRYVSNVNCAFYGLSGNREYATAIAVRRLNARQSLTARELMLEIEILRQLGATAKSVDLLFQISRDSEEDYEVRLRALRALDAGYWRHAPLREDLVGDALSLTQDKSLSAAQRIAAIELLRKLKSVDLSPSPKILARVVQLAVVGEDAKVRRTALRAIAGLKSRQAARKGEVNLIAASWIRRLDQPATPAELKAIIDALVALEAVQVIPRLQALVLDEVDSSKEQNNVAIDGIAALTSLKIKSNRAQTLLKDLQPLVKLSEVRPCAEEKLVGVIGAAVQEHQIQDTERSLSLLHLLVELREDRGMGRRILQQFRQRNDVAAIPALLELSITSDSDSIYREAAQVAIDLIRTNNVREREALDSLAKWLDVADANFRRGVLDQLAALPWRDRELFVAIVASVSVRQTMDEVLAIAEALNEEVVDAPPTKDDASALQLAFDDPSSKVREFARALLCARRLVAKDVQFLEEWIPQQETKLEIYQSTPSEDLRSSGNHDRYDRALTTIRVAINNLKQSSEQVRHALSEAASNGNTVARCYGLWRLEQKLYAIDRQFWQVHGMMRRDADRADQDPANPSRSSDALDISDVVEQWTDLESLLRFYVGEHE